jgi:hypothetical protein
MNQFMKKNGSEAASKTDKLVIGVILEKER